MTPFCATCRPHELPEEISATIRDTCALYGNDPGELINILHALQLRFGYLPESVQRAIALHLNIPVSRIYGVVTFYTFFTMRPKGKYAISVCMGTACYVRGSSLIYEEIQRILGIGPGQTTPDGKFTLDSLRCVGACGLAPVMVVGEKIYGKLSVHEVKKIIDSLE